MIRLWCEWDYGQDGLVFLEEEHGQQWLWQQMLDVDGIEYLTSETGHNFSGPNDIFEEGLAGFEPVRIYEPR